MNRLSLFLVVMVVTALLLIPAAIAADEGIFFLFQNYPEGILVAGEGPELVVPIGSNYAIYRSKNDPSGESISSLDGNPLGWVWIPNGLSPTYPLLRVSIPDVLTFADEVFANFGRNALIPIDCSQFFIMGDVSGLPKNLSTPFAITNRGGEIRRWKNSGDDFVIEQGEICELESPEGLTAVFELITFSEFLDSIGEEKSEIYELLGWELP